ncbi:MAG: FxsA family protein [Sciscionella sp.]
MAVFFLLYVIIEIAAVVAVASTIGLGWALLLLVAGALVGSWLARREGGKAMRAMLSSARSGASPHAELTDGMLIGLGGVLILLPGFVSDLLGFALLVPPLRGIVRRRWVAGLERRAPGLRTSAMRSGHVVVDSEVVADEPRATSPQADTEAHPGFRGTVVEGSVKPNPSQS